MRFFNRLVFVCFFISVILVTLKDELHSSLHLFARTNTAMASSKKVKKSFTAQSPTSVSPDSKDNQLDLLRHTMVISNGKHVSFKKVSGCPRLTKKMVSDIAVLLQANMESTTRITIQPEIKQPVVQAMVEAVALNRLNTSQSNRVKFDSFSYGYLNEGTEQANEYAVQTGGNLSDATMINIGVKQARQRFFVSNFSGNTNINLAVAAPGNNDHTPSIEKKNSNQPEEMRGL